MSVEFFKGLESNLTRTGMESPRRGDWLFSSEKRRLSALRRAAVLVLLRVGALGPEVLLTRRADSMRLRPGEAAFPGGAEEADDVCAEATALRETLEEIGLEPSKARLLGRLDVFEGAIGWEIVPIVAALGDGFEAKPAPEEISDVWWEPLADLAARAAFKSPESGRATRAHGLSPAAGRPESAWGMTAGILHDLLVRTGHVRRDALDPPLSSRLQPPLALRLVPTGEADSFVGFDSGTTGIPIFPHPGAFGAIRRHHTHEGVDLYAPEGAEVFALEDGRVSSIHVFTGLGAEPSTPWWLPTCAVVVEGALGALFYGEIHPEPGLSIGEAVPAGRRLGRVARVLEKDKGRPTSMLHLELHEAGTTAAVDWTHGTTRPKTLRDPTAALLRASALKASGTEPSRRHGGKEG